MYKVGLYQHVVPHNPQNITDKDKFVCHLVVNNVFKTRFTSAQTVQFFLNIEFHRSRVCLKKSKLHIIMFRPECLQ